jgi:hypothetical protein
MMKNILGVHGKTSNLALHAELGLFPLCFKACKLMFRYYTRLIQLEENNDSKYDLLRSTFEEDKHLVKTIFAISLFSWGKWFIVSPRFNGKRMSTQSNFR